MQFILDYGREQVALEADGARLIGKPAPPPPSIVDPTAAVRAALESPYAFPALRRALTPDDHVAVVVDDALPHLMELLVPTLEHVLSAGARAEAVTLLSPPMASVPSWLNDLPEHLEEAVHEVHNPSDRNKLSYLATTKKGRRIYLNRTAVDADQLIVLSGRRYDPLLGHGGAEGTIFPAFSDEATRREVGKQLHFQPPGKNPWPVQEEAVEAAWLLGAPFFVQVIEGPGDGIGSIVAGSVEASKEGQRVQDAFWRRTAPAPAELVVAAMSGDPSRHSFADLAAALATASRVVRPGGRIVLLTQARPALGPGTDVLLHADDPQQAWKELQKQADWEHAPAVQWAQAAAHARLTLLSDLPSEMAEDLFATPLDHAEQAQRLLNAASDVLFLPDAHKSLAVIE